MHIVSSYGIAADRGGWSMGKLIVGGCIRTCYRQVETPLRLPLGRHQTTLSVYVRDLDIPSSNPVSTANHLFVRLFVCCLGNSASTPVYETST